MLYGKPLYVIVSYPNTVFNSNNLYPKYALQQCISHYTNQMITIVLSINRGPHRRRFIMNFHYYLRINYLYYNNNNNCIEYRIYY